MYEFDDDLPQDEQRHRQNLAAINEIARQLSSIQQTLMAICFVLIVVAVLAFKP